MVNPLDLHQYRLTKSLRHYGFGVAH